MITLDMRRWGVWHLVGISAAYWTALAAATLTPFGWLAMRPSRASTPAAHHGSSMPHALGGAMPNAWGERAASTPSPIPAERRETRS